MTSNGASKYVSLAVFAGLVVAAAQFGGIFRPDAWYAALAKPAWTPPNWVFPIAWTILYVMIALAGWFAWRAAGFGAAIAFWLVQLVANGAWSYLMFGRKEIAAALIDIAVLWVVIVAFILAVRGSSRAAAWLFVPYLAWVTYAATLNFEVWRLNP